LQFQEAESFRLVVFFRRQFHPQYRLLCHRQYRQLCHLQYRRLCLLLFREECPFLVVQVQEAQARTSKAFAPT
jgi:hypothetical protein